MGNNVNTQPSTDSNKISIRWITFSSQRENQIDAKKLKSGKEAYKPQTSKVETTYLIKQNDEWERCIKDSNKLKKIQNATIKNEEKKKRLNERINLKYHTRNNTFSR